MRFVETRIFTKEIRDILVEDEYRSLQLALKFRPEQGNLIKGSGGIRKIRWGAKGKDKSGGCLIIYFWDKPTDAIYLLFVYPKSSQEDLTPAQIRILRDMVKEEFK